jgi:hypothetical protein
MTAITTPLAMPRRLSVRTLLAPGPRLRVTFLTLLAGLVIAGITVTVTGWPWWVFNAIVLATLLPVGISKWREEKQRFGVVIMLLSLLLTAQGVHTIEHLVQWGQYHVMGFTPRQSNGLVSAANAEWVHFVWNWSVLILVIVLMRGGMRNPLAWLLLAVAGFHAVEHTYTTIQHVQVLSELRALGVTNVTAQGLPGIVGRDGWLARSPWTQGTFICSLPGLTTAVRLDVHFWWNMLETGLLLAAGNVFLAARATDGPSTASSG